MGLLQFHFLKPSLSKILYLKKKISKVFLNSNFLLSECCFWRSPYPEMSVVEQGVEYTQWIVRNWFELSETNHIHLQLLSLSNRNWLFYVLITVERGGWICRADRRWIYSSWGVYDLTRILSTPFVISIHLQEAYVLLSASILFSSCLQDIPWYPKDIPKISQRYPQDIPKIFLRYP